MNHGRSWRCAAGGRTGARHARRTPRHEAHRHDPRPEPHPPHTGTRCEGFREDPSAAVIARLTELGGRLGGQPRPEFRARLRESLLGAHEEARRAAAERRGTPSGAGPRPAATAARPAPEPPPIRAPLSVRLRPAVLALALLAAALGTSLAAHRAVPGDPLYPLKRASESALIHLSVDDAARAELELGTALNRAAEAAELAADPARERLLEETIDDMTASTRSAISRLAHPAGAPGYGKLQHFATKQRNVVEPLIPALNGSSRRKASDYLHLIRGFEGP